MGDRVDQALYTTIRASPPGQSAGSLVSDSSLPRKPLIEIHYLRGKLEQLGVLVKVPMSSNRKLLLGMVSLTPGRVRGDIVEAGKARDEIEALLEADYFDGAPFSQIGMIIRYGTKANLTPEYQPICKNELPIAVEVEMNTLRRFKGEDLRNEFKLILLEALIAVGKQYGLAHDSLVKKLGEIKTVKG
jgi:hypothetical protein